MQTSFKIDIYSVIDDRGKSKFVVLSPRELKKFMSKKKNKSLLAKQLIKSLKVQIKIS